MTLATIMKKITLIFITLISLQSFSQDTPCVWQDGFYRYYVRLITDNIPAPDFNKTDFINHLITNSNPPNSDLIFLNNSITEVYPSFPIFINEYLQKTVTVVCDDDSMDTFLIVYSESIELVEFQCEAELGVEDFDWKNKIKIYPNPVSENSFIQIDIKAGFKNLKIHDITGKQLYSIKIENLNLIDFSPFMLKNGIYFLTFSSENLTISKKIIYK